jgi:branched-subunit amino acid transport protein
MSTWIVVLCAGLASYAFRSVPVLALTRVELPVGVERSLRHAGPAAMAAMGATAVLHREPGEPVAVLVASVIAVALSMLLMHRGVRLPFIVGTGLVAYQLVVLGARVVGVA